MHLKLNIRDCTNLVDLNIRASYRDGNFNASVGFGVSFAGSAAGSGAKGWEYRRSFGAGWDDGRQGFGVYSTTFSGFGGKFSQKIGGFSYRNGDFGFRYENDGKPFKGWLGDGDDKYRTAALAINIGEFSAGINLFTGKRDSKSYYKEEHELLKVGFRDQYGRRFRRGYVYEQDSKYRLGALYLGYNGYRIGTNSEHVRHAFQNWFAHSIISPQPGFQNTSWDWQPYFQYQSPNIFSLW